MILQKTKLDFSPLTLKDADTVKHYTAFNCHPSCDLTFGCFFMWRDHYSIKICDRGDALLSSLQDEDGNTCYNLPLAENADKIKSAITDIVEASPDAAVRFYTVTEEYLDFFKTAFPFCEIKEQPEHFDYIYKTKDLAEFYGKKYAGQRNMLHQFLRQSKTREYKPVTADNINEVIAFFSETYLKTTTALYLSEEEENKKTLEVLNNFDLYGFFGGALYADGKIVGFSLGEKAGDTVFIHIEKADRTVKGAYQTIVNEFAKNFAQNAEFINREDDMGDIGLKTSKLSYHPVNLLKKYSVIIKKI